MDGRNVIIFHFNSISWNHRWSQKIVCTWRCKIEVSIIFRLQNRFICSVTSTGTTPPSAAVVSPQSKLILNVEQHTPQLWQSASTPAPSTMIVVGFDCNLTSGKNSHGESCANIFLPQAQSKHYFQVTWLGRNKLCVRC